jgi:hypothetical protein
MFTMFHRIVEVMRLLPARWQRYHPRNGYGFICDTNVPHQHFVLIGVYLLHLRQFHLDPLIEITIVEELLQRVEGFLHLNNKNKAVSEHFIVQIGIVRENGIKRYF